MQEEDGTKRVGDEIKKLKYKDEGNLGRLKRGMYSRLKQPSKRPRRVLRDADTIIKEDWETKKPEKVQEEQDKNWQEEMDVNKTPIQKPKSLKKPMAKWVVLAGVFAAVSLAAAAVYIVGGAGVISASRVQIDIMGPHSVAGGSVLELNVAVTNNNTRNLELADMIVRYPPGTRVPMDLATDMSVQRIPLGVIPAGETRTGSIRAVVFGSAGESKDVVVELEYRTSGSNVLHVSRGQHSILISSNTLDISVDSNKESVSGQTADIIVEVVSRAGVLLRDVVLSAEYPFGFAPNTFDPKPTDGDNFWELGDIAPGEKYRIRISGKISGQSGDERVLRFNAGFRKEVDDKAVSVTLADSEFVIGLKEPFLGVEMLFADKAADEYVGKAGEPIPIEILWRNNLDVALSNVVLAASVYGEGVDPYTVSVDRGFYRSIDSVVLWNKTTTSGEFENIAAGQEGRVSFSVTPRVLEQLVGSTKPEVRIEIHAAGQRLGETGVPETLQSTVQGVIKIASDAKLASSALYYTNPFESAGPLPPKVHEETTYGVVWEVSNTTNTLRDATVTATLPPYVRWLRTVSPVAENIVYNQTENTLTWYLGTVLPETGYKENEPRRVAFNIGLVPSASQIGGSPELILNQKFTGYDAFVEADVEAEADDITTELKEDEFVNGQAVVQP